MQNQTEILENLRKGKLEIVFRKSDGTERTMICSLSNSLVPPEIITEKPKKKANPDVQPVFDLEKKSWRSFRWDSIIASKVVE